MTCPDDELQASVDLGGNYLFMQKDGTEYGCDISGIDVTADEIGL